MRKIPPLVLGIVLIFTMLTFDRVAGDTGSFSNSRTFALEQTKTFAIQSIRTYDECTIEDLTEDFQILGAMNNELAITIKPIAGTSARELTIKFPDGSENVYSEHDTRNVFIPKNWQEQGLETRVVEHVQLTDNGLMVSYLVAHGGYANICASLVYSRSDMVNVFVGNWNSGDVCKEAENPHKWEVSLMKLSEQDVVGSIHFHRCPGGGSVIYFVAGTAMINQNFIELTGGITGGDGDLYDSNYLPDSETFKFTPGEAPFPNYAP